MQKQSRTPALTHYLSGSLAWFNIVRFIPYKL